MPRPDNVFFDLYSIFYAVDNFDIIFFFDIRSQDIGRSDFCFFRFRQARYGSAKAADIVERREKKIWQKSEAILKRKKNQGRTRIEFDNCFLGDWIPDFRLIPEVSRRRRRKRKITFGALSRWKSGAVPPRRVWAYVIDKRQREAGAPATVANALLPE